MPQIRRWSVIGALCVLALAMLSACGTTLPASAKVSFMVFGDPAELKAYQQLVDAFERETPGAAVTLIHIPGQADYRTRLSADFAAGKPADVILINYRRLAGFAAKGALEPLGPYLDRSVRLQRTDFYPAALEAFTWQGTLTCIPQNISSLVVYYNKTLFDAAGVAYPKDDWTWEEFLTTAQTLTDDTDGDGRIDRYGLGTEATLIRVAPFVWQNGGGLIYPNRSLALTSPEAFEAVQWFLDLQRKHHVVPGAVEEKAEESESRFQNGRMAMYLNSRRVVPAFREITAFDWDVAPLPRHRAPATILHSDAYCLPAASRAKAAAWQLIEFANSVEGQTLLAATGRTVPSLKAVAESPAFLDPNARPAHSRAFLDAIPYTYALPLLANWADIESIADDELQRAFYGEVTDLEAMQAAAERSAQYFTEGE